MTEQKTRFYAIIKQNKELKMTHFLGENKLKKFSNQLGVTFEKGREIAHENGYIIYFLWNQTNKFAVLIKKGKVLDSVSIPDEFKNNYEIRISNKDKLYLLI
jgi:hypothetical protein